MNDVRFTRKEIDQREKYQILLFWGGYLNLPFARQRQPALGVHPAWATDDRNVVMSAVGPKKVDRQGTSNEDNQKFRSHLMTRRRVQKQEEKKSYL